MAKGGKREGAGRPKGAQNKKTVEQVEAVKKSGKTPLEYLLEVMRNDELDNRERTDAAKAAAPFIHPRLASTEVTGKDGGDISIVVTAVDETIL